MSRRRRRRLAVSEWQQQLLNELESLATDHPQEVQILEGPTVDAQRDAAVRIKLGTSEIPMHARGLQLDAAEEFIVRIPPGPFIPPRVDVDHRRFLGYPHVLLGTRLCIYLDPSREWQPAEGIAGFLNRLWGWLNDAAGGVFDAATAMYHAVGGVLHRTAGVPALVIREEGSSKLMQAAYVLQRTQYRSDFTYRDDLGGHRVPVVTLSSELPLGATRDLDFLLRILDDPYADAAEGRRPRILPQSEGFLRRLLASAARNPDGSPQYFVLAVPHPAGGPHHLLGGRLTAQTADSLRAVARDYGVASFDPDRINRDASIDWCTISDERKQVTIRRDEARPVNGLLGKTVHMWGCGGLGSWIAEFIARAGASTITVCDPGSVSGGLLVRQNYLEDDIGMTKAEALGQRLEAIRDDLTVVVETNPIPKIDESVLSADLIVDATVNNSIAGVLDAIAGKSERRGLIAQVATDARSGTLGVANICATGGGLTPSTIDRRTGESVLARGDLEVYHTLWATDPDSEDTLIPTRGCSVPTFHGSAADLAGVAAALVNVIGSHLLNPEGTATSGTHLVALPYSGSEPAHLFVPIGQDDETAAQASG
jgi:hypothetical protein